MGNTTENLSIAIIQDIGQRIVDWELQTYISQRDAKTMMVLARDGSKFLGYFTAASEVYKGFVVDKSEEKIAHFINAAKEAYLVPATLAIGDKLASRVLMPNAVAFLCIEGLKKTGEFVTDSDKWPDFYKNFLNKIAKAIQNDVKKKVADIAQRNLVEGETYIVGTGFGILTMTKKDDYIEIYRINSIEGYEKAIAYASNHKVTAVDQNKWKKYGYYKPSRSELSEIYAEEFKEVLQGYRTMPFAETEFVLRGGRKFVKEKLDKGENFDLNEKFSLYKNDGELIVKDITLKNILPILGVVVGERNIISEFDKKIAEFAEVNTDLGIGFGKPMLEKKEIIYDLSSPKLAKMEGVTVKSDEYSQTTYIENKDGSGKVILNGEELTELNYQKTVDTRSQGGIIYHSYDFAANSRAREIYDVYYSPEPNTIVIYVGDWGVVIENFHQGDLGIELKGSPVAIPTRENKQSKLPEQNFIEYADIKRQVTEIATNASISIPVNNNDKIISAIGLFDTASMLLAATLAGVRTNFFANNKSNTNAVAKTVVQNIELQDSRLEEKPNKIAI
ncbi:MAG: hypothetical protein F6K54_23180 [Okeania sp. SIO3B5]|uniref:hypothetical protein n=1 Tax=Okeania sp. SIO3B5 TaxID=2607811 RepID=UPI0014011F5E|nr:hypothetical protein [Okeania sp. SIO3B5]NEO55712.1 hypothetical protein [Okeania sp. SIO3B5]